ncbi:MAG: CAP domain-containing protein [Scytonema sp. PMC 1069.18]|nr:CAP domain-containing protein [Scytonema sp. PMC 1069.18]MEC4883613.1 CAP domain-containing protein [Scytonema sp. PMC 1070.18]
MSVNLFDVNFYRSANSDLKGMNDAQALSHFQQHGLNEGRSFSPFVDLSFYRASNSDLANISNQQAYEHLTNFGVREGRRFSPFFDLSFYRQNNTDLASLNNDQLFEHFVTYGLQEGRIASSYMNSDYTGNTLNTARNIALDSKTVIYRESVGDADTNDYYRISFSSQNTNLKLRVNGLNANLDLEVLNSNGQKIAQSTGLDTVTESLSFENLQAGTYYIRVFQGVNGANTNYNLTLSPTPSSTLPQPASVVPDNSFIQRVVDLTNYQRQQAGLQPLRLNLKLINSAQIHSEDMALRDFFNHTNPNGSSVRDRTLQQGYVSSSVGENIAAGYTTPEQVVQAWMTSETHRANMLNPQYQEIGIGYYYLANDTGNVNYNHYWTQDFGVTV